MDLDREREISVEIFDVAGRRQRILLQGETAPAGQYQLHGDGRSEGGGGQAPGIYLPRLRRGEQSSTRKLLKLR